MSIEVTCDDCGRDFRVNDSFAGKSVRCKCGAKVSIPDDDGFEDDDAPVRKSKSKRRRSQSSDSTPMLGFAIGGGVGLVVIIVIAVMALRSGGGNSLPAPPVVASTTPQTPTIPSTGIPAQPHSMPPSTTNTVPTVPTVPTMPTTPPASTTPTVPTTPSAPNAKPTPTAAPAATAATTRFQSMETTHQVGHSGKDAKLAISPGGKFVSVDRVIHSMATGDEFWTVPAAFGGGDKDALQAVSSDGLAFAEGDEGAQKLTLYTKEKEGGENKIELPVVKGASKLTFLQFGDARQLVAGFSSGQNMRVAVYNAEKTKKAAKDFATEGFTQRTAAVSSDGKFIAVASLQSLKVYDLAKGTSVASMAAPANGPQSFSSCSGVAFSPDNEELAAVLGTGLLIWTNRGKLQEEFGGSVTAAHFNKFNGLNFLADKSGFLVNGQELFDRSTKMVAWQLKPAMFYNHPAGVFDAENIIVSGGSASNGQIAAIKIPRDELEKAAKAIASKVDAVIAPGNSISIEYNVGEPRFSSRQEVTNQLHTALTARLAQIGISVAESQPVTMKVIYTEVAGETAEYSEGRGFGPPIPRPPGFGRSPFDKPGVKVTETKHTFTATLVRKNDPKVWWSTNFTQDAPQSLKGEATDSNVRTGSFEVVKNRISNFELPRFMPVDPSIPSLPLKSDLSGL